MEVVGELLLVDYPLLREEVRRQAHGNIADLVDSAAEFSFRPGTLVYADDCSIVTDAGQERLAILVAFRNHGVEASFSLSIGPEDGRIDLVWLKLDRPGQGGEPSLSVLRDAIGRARTRGSDNRGSGTPSLN